MPQMSPMMWMTLFVFFILIFLFFNMMNYFNFLTYKLIYNKKMKKNINFNFLIWKW